MKKSADRESTSLTTLSMVENPDILKSVVARRQERATQDHAGPDKSSTPNSTTPTIIVGFAAETGDPHHTPLEHAQLKLKDKGCELLVCNDVGQGKVFGRNTNRGWVLSRDGEVTDIPSTSKFGLADSVWDAVANYEDRVR